MSGRDPRPADAAAVRVAAPGAASTAAPPAGNLVVAGPLIVDEILDERGRTRVELGGLAYALAGARGWVRECRAVANAGRDLGEWHGPWLAANGIDAAGVRRTLPATMRSRLRYAAGGLFVEEPVHGAATLERIRELDHRTADDLLARVDTDTLGVYLEASAADPIWRDERIYELAARLPVMWEVQTDSALDLAWRPRTLEIAARLGLYSVNLPEALALFGAPDRASAEAAILAHGAACYLRLGAEGSALVSGGRARFAPSPPVGRVVDTTGCGNAATAAALAAIAIGLPADRVAEAGNLSAAEVLAGYGPPARVRPLRLPG